MCRGVGALGHLTLLLPKCVGECFENVGRWCDVFHLTFPITYLNFEERIL